MKYTILLFFPIFFAACSAANAPQTANAVAAPNANATAVKTETAPPIIAPGHSSGETAAAPNSQSAKNKGSNPNERPIDTSEMDAAIVKGEKDFKARPNDAAAKKALADAYAARGFALTQAAQYRAALGDFRKCLKLDSSNAEARAMHDRIIQIFQSLQREPPKEGEEPPPLPYSKS
jgi:tetratricopeptide (TPR) repeat protein